ncbi:MAG: hypothetical protein M0Q94_03860 [Candidatus Cloacimonetes bacterium]|jgi:hypothetical protein|nr:hypothetical protein [Candidatus Cloacimonadota bacterium]
MAIDKIHTDILSRGIIQESVKEATSGKKDNVKNSDKEVKKSTLQDSTVFSKDAKKLQETEVILQNALQKLKEMDELNLQKLEGIQSKIDNDFYNNDAVLDEIIDEIFPEEQIKKSVSRRIQAEKYLSELNKLDQNDTLDDTKIQDIKEKINKGYYNSKEITEKIADELLNIADI